MKLAQAYAALRFDPAVPLWLLGLLTVICLAALAPALLRRARGAVWRTLAFIVLLRVRPRRMFEARPMSAAMTVAELSHDCSGTVSSE